MNARYFRWVVSLMLCLWGIGVPAPLAAQTLLDPQGFLRDYTKGPSSFPNLFRPYEEQPLAPLVMENSPRLRNLIRDGRLELSLAEALALALENNLDIGVQRYIIPFAQADILRAKSGQAARGVSGASVPGGLSAGALGAGVSDSGGGGGGGGAGGITGGGGAVSIGSMGSFDPAVNFNFSWDRVSSPLNTTVVSGTPTSTSYATSYSGSYAQMFPTGTSYSLSMNGLRQSTTENRLFNPAVVTGFSIRANQPLLNGWGRLPNERFMLVARNNQRISEEVFRQQVVATIVQVENTYWDLAGFQENVRVAEQSLAVAKRLHEDTKKQAEIGTQAPLDVVAAESEVAGRERDLIVAQTNLQLQETRLKNLLSKRPDPDLDAARVVITDQMPEPRDADLPEVRDALATAAANRPDLRQAQGNLQNQQIAIRFTENSLMPGGSIFGLYSGSGLRGDTPATSTGVIEALGQTFRGDFPEYAGGLGFSVPIRNRSAQADHLRAQMEGNQMEIGLQRSRNQVELEVRQALIGLMQGKAQVEAAHEAVRLGSQTLDAEQKKLRAGVSTSYQVILRERDLVSAQLAEVQAVSGYAKALVEMDRSMGTTMDRNGIRFEDALSGAVSRMPTPPFSVRGFGAGQEGPR